MNVQKKIKKLIDETSFKLWFEDAVFLEKSLVVTSKFKANTIKEKFSSQLKTAFQGEYKITVKTKKAVSKNNKPAEMLPPVQLPLWPEPARGTPNSFLRSAIFAAIQGKGRHFLKGALLGSQKGYTVKFTGEQLDQSDLDVWEQAIHLSKSESLGDICIFRANAFLKAIGRHNGKSDYDWLHSAITRLVACAVEIRGGQKVFTGSLLTSCVRDEHTGIYRLRLDPDLMKLYGASDWTAIQWEERAALKGKPLALWLHGYYASHAAPYPIKIETLRELSGSGTKELKHFKAALKKAFAHLEKAADIKVMIEGDLVSVEHCPTPAQLKHLNKKSKTPRH